MISCNPRVLIESGNGTLESAHCISTEGYGVMLLNPCDACEIGSSSPTPPDFDPHNYAITWVFKSIKSLDVAIQNLNRIRSDMEAFENGDFEV